MKLREIHFRTEGILNHVHIGFERISSDLHAPLHPLRQIIHEVCSRGQIALPNYSPVESRERGKMSAIIPARVDSREVVRCECPAGEVRP